MGLFKKATPPHQTALAMIGARAGNRVLVAGHPDPGVVAELARTTGLNGQTLIALAPDSRAAYDAAAASAGVFLETLDLPASPLRLPDTAGDHDVVVLHIDLLTRDDATRAALAHDAFARLRRGGRVVVIEGRPSKGWFGGRPATIDADSIVRWLDAAGGLAARALGTADGVSYFEARKAR